MSGSFNRSRCKTYIHTTWTGRLYFDVIFFQLLSLFQLEMLVMEVDAGEDWRVDPVLREACKPVVDVACSEVRGGDAR